MAHQFDLENMLNGCRRVKGAVTIASAMDLLEIGRTVYILLNTEKNVAVIKGEVMFVQHHESNGEPDIKLTLEFRKSEIESGIKKKHVSTVILGDMLNGRSPFIGDEVQGNVSRLFVLEQDSIDYYEIVRYVRQLHTLARVSEENPAVTKLLKHKPPTDPTE